MKLNLSAMWTETFHSWSFVCECFRYYQVSFVQTKVIFSVSYSRIQNFQDVDLKKLCLVNVKIAIARLRFYHGCCQEQDADYEVKHVLYEPLLLAGSNFCHLCSPIFTCFLVVRSVTWVRVGKIHKFVTYHVPLGCKQVRVSSVINCNSNQ